MKSSVKDYPTSLSTPIDKTAARVVSKGFQYKPNKKLNQEIWDTPPPTLPVPSGIKDLIGTRQNRMVIVGYLEHHPKTGYKLLARCDCGKYEKRAASRWRKMRAFDDCCAICRHTWFLKHRHLTNEERDRILEKEKLKVKQD